MKKTVLFFLMIILIASCHQEEIPSVSDKPEGNQLIFDLSDEDALQGCIYVKLKEEPTEEVQIRSIGNTVRTGIKVLDRAASSLKIERMERTFPTPANLKNVLVRRGFIYGTMFGSPKTHQRLVQLLK